MKIRAAVFGSFLIVFCLLTLPILAQGKSIILSNANIIDVVTAEVQTCQSIFINDGKIGSIKPATNDLPEGTNIVDVRNNYVFPGLIDAHAHVDNLEDTARPLSYGTTTIRSASVGSYADGVLQALVQEGKIAGHEIIPSGVFVQLNFTGSILADPALAVLYGGVEAEEELRKLVQINLKNRAQIIKTRSAERAGIPEADPRKQVYSDRQLDIIVGEAAKQDIPVMAHAHGAVLDAAKAGMISIEHGTYASDEALNLIKEKGTYLVPTYSAVIDLTEPGGDYDHPVITIRGQYMLPQMEEMLKTAMQIGVKIVASTDSGYGNSVATEFVNFVYLGMEPFIAIQSAMSTAADLLQVSDRTGTVEAGKEADLNLIYGNPLEGIRALQDIIMMISNGVVVQNRLPFILKE